MSAIDADDARLALTQVESVSWQMRRAVYAPLVSSILVLWGLILVLVWGDFLRIPMDGDRLALCILGFGFLATAILAFRKDKALCGEANRRGRKRLALLCAGVVLFAIVLTVLLAISFPVRVLSGHGRMAVMLGPILLGCFLQFLWMRDWLLATLTLLVPVSVLAAHTCLSRIPFHHAFPLLGFGGLLTLGIAVRLRWR